MKNIEVVCAIINYHGRFLIAKRGKGVHENIWEFPGGKVENGESLETAVLREIKEELNLEIRVIKAVKDVFDQREDCTLHVSAFLCESVAGELRLRVHHEVRYVSAKELFDYHFEEADKAILLALQEREDEE